ncbi:MAG: hypothetical protein ACYC65_07070 [Candidatus Limnocylindrales bacterium]
MEAAADGVVFFTGISLGVLMIIDGAGGLRVGEIVAGVVIAALIGVPLLMRDVRAYLRVRLRG